MMHSALLTAVPEWSSRLRTKRGLEGVDYYEHGEDQVDWTSRWCYPISLGSLMAITLRCKIPAKHAESEKTWNPSH